jgi:putative ABC transport system permease protein
LLIAVRNLTRNRRRALMALLTVSMAVIAMVLADGFVQWIFWAMREGAIQSQLGHVQVVRPGYNRAGAADPFAYIISGHTAEHAGNRENAGRQTGSPSPVGHWPDQSRRHHRVLHRRR